MRHASARFIKDLTHIARHASHDLSVLEKQYWPQTKAKIEKQRARLANPIPRDDPLRASIDLLSPLHKSRDETVHTSALAYLLNPDSEHGFGLTVLKELLEQINGYGTRAGSILRLANQAAATIRVEPEYRSSVEGVKHRSFARYDLRIEIHSRNRRELIIIENKIDAPEGREQLKTYECEAEKWGKRMGKRKRPLLVFLTLDARRPKSERQPSIMRGKKWICLSYLHVAAVLRRVWKESKNRNASGHPWLGLYIASLMQDVLGISLSESSWNATVEEIETYLSRARK